MDFSSCITALRTLRRRQGIDEDTIKCIDCMGQIISNNSVAENVSEFETLLGTLLHQTRWDAMAVGIAISTEYIRFMTPKCTEQLIEVVENHLDHKEPRLRTLAARFLGALVKRDGCDVYLRFKTRITEDIRENLKRSLDYEEEDNEKMQDPTALNIVTPPPSPTHALDDTTGWKSLTTSVVAYKEIILGAGSAFIENQYLTAELIDLVIVQTTKHINRHVRAAGFDTCTALCQIAPESFLNQSVDVCDAFSAAIAKGLQDNWSQVRFAASVSVRTFLTKLSPEKRTKYFQLLVPRMCLNRYYLAEGVKLYSQDTWKTVMGDTGRDVVASIASDMADYYVHVSDYDNHVVREAACHCIAELGTKVDKDAIRPHVAPLLNALLLCFKDDSWPVRDAACVASGQFVIGFPQESRACLDNLMKLWVEHLSDNIWSVREDAAMALANAERAYGLEVAVELEKIISCYSKKVQEQPAMSEDEYQQKLTDEKAHTGNQVYSCGSLAPKLRKGGCSDCRFHRPKEPWEYTDGIIYLVRELCMTRPEYAESCLPTLAQVATHRHFPQSSTLRETLWKALPIIFQRLGKKTLKRHLELFLDELQLAVKSLNRLESFAAQECVRRLSDQIGPMIFRGRVANNCAWEEHLMPYATQREY